MNKNIVRATWLGMLLIASLLLVSSVSSCSDVDLKADVEYFAESGQLRITNNDSCDWLDVVVTVNYTYQLSIPNIPAGAVHTVEAHEFAGLWGPDFDPDTTTLSQVLIECDTSKGYRLYSRVWA